MIYYQYIPDQFLGRSKEENRSSLSRFDFALLTLLRQLRVYLGVLQLQVLVQRSLGTIRFLAGLYLAFEVPANKVGRSPMSPQLLATGIKILFVLKPLDPI